jgi:osmotically-inducible protein OsmY
MARARNIFKLLVSLWLTAAFMGCAAPQKHESSMRYTEDSIITAKVKASLFNDASLNTLPIHVRTEHAVVRLSGLVDSPLSITKAGEVAARVEGVVSVANELGTIN